MKKDLIKEFNRVFYKVEADLYDERHPEVLAGNYSWWNEVGQNLLGLDAEGVFNRS